jgi:hypothetical protein
MTIAAVGARPVRPSGVKDEDTDAAFFIEEIIND